MQTTKSKTIRYQGRLYKSVDSAVDRSEFDTAHNLGINDRAIKITLIVLAAVIGMPLVRGWLTMPQQTTIINNPPANVKECGIISIGC